MNRAARRRDARQRQQAAARIPHQTPFNFTVHAVQADVLACEARTIVFPAGRRTGKSHTGVLRIGTQAYRSAHRGDGPGVWWVVAPTHKLLRPLWRKFRRHLPKGWVTASWGTERMPDTLAIGDQRIEFRSGDDPESLVAEGLKGVWIDEAGIIKERVWVESLLPTLIDEQASALLTGTPKGRNFFWRLYNRGLDPMDPEVAAFHATTYANPFLKGGPAEITRLRREMTQRLFEQEVLAVFLTDEGAVFRRVRHCVRQTEGKFSTKPTRVLGVDVAKHRDFTVVHGLDEDGWTTNWDRWRGLSWPIQKQRIAAASRRLKCPVVIDATGVGDPVYDDLKTMGVRIYPYKFTSQSKEQLVEHLALGIEELNIGLPDEPVLVNELEAYEYEITRAGHTRYNAPEGAHDDCVMALGLAYWGLTRRRHLQVPEHTKARVVHRP